MILLLCKCMSVSVCVRLLLQHCLFGIWTIAEPHRSIMSSLNNQSPSTKSPPFETSSKVAIDIFIFCLVFLYIGSSETMRLIDFRAATHPHTQKTGKPTIGQHWGIVNSMWTNVCKILFISLLWVLRDSTPAKKKKKHRPLSRSAQPHKNHLNWHQHFSFFALMVFSYSFVHWLHFRVHRLLLHFSFIYVG